MRKDARRPRKNPYRRRLFDDLGFGGKRQNIQSGNKKPCYGRNRNRCLPKNKLFAFELSGGRLRNSHKSGAERQLRQGIRLVGSRFVSQKLRNGLCLHLNQQQHRICDNKRGHVHRQLHNRGRLSRKARHGNRKLCFQSKQSQKHRCRKQCQVNRRRSVLQLSRP